MRQMQKVQSQVPVLGSIGKHQSSLFKKSFQKTGEPELDRPISVTIETVPLSGKMKARYEKYREHLGLPPLAVTMDSTQINKLLYYNLKISNLVHLVEELNQQKNAALKEYLQEDMELVLLSSMSVVVDQTLSQELDKAEKLYLNTDSDGDLSLYIEGSAPNGKAIKQSSLEIFDFQRANFCWKLDKRGRTAIAQILIDGTTCPGSTKANPKKLNRTPDYLKL
ncbi:hypothetical protein MACH07_22090 [Flagellimonas marinaquae]|uniref:Uncharacterized protein n=2 Tax=Flagellimonas marinaquae TaxID=254955 RepID=A0AA48KLQ6_9FLAO|nr:hypothetical protein MACH07_22090 [Allomuricauda aquimarina]